VAVSVIYYLVGGQISLKNMVDDGTLPLLLLGIDIDNEALQSLEKPI
jgi:hypothetical protein